MRARRVPDVARLLDPEADAWSAQRAERVALLAAPLGLQPTAYLRAKWSKQPYGTVAAVHATCAHDGRRIAFRLRWASAVESLAGGEAFPDAAAIALPLHTDAPLLAMGAESAPIHILHWQAGTEAVRSVLATGIGSSRPGPEADAQARAVWKGGAWRVVIAWPLESEATAPLAAGSETKVGFAIWNGANRERAGIKAVSPNWVPVELDA